MTPTVVKPHTVVSKLPLQNYPTGGKENHIVVSKYYYVLQYPTTNVFLSNYTCLLHCIVEILNYNCWYREKC